MHSHKIEIILSTALVFLMSVAVIWIRTAHLKATYEFNQKEREINQLKKTEQLLRIKLAKASAPQRLRELSPNFNLSAPKIHQLYRFKERP